MDANRTLFPLLVTAVLVEALAGVALLAFGITEGRPWTILSGAFLLVAAALLVYVVRRRFRPVVVVEIERLQRNGDGR